MRIKKIFALVLTLLILTLCQSNFSALAETETNSAQDTNITFVVNVPEGTSGDVYVNVMNVETSETHVFYLYKYNNYTTFEYLPIGKYKVVEGGQLNDMTSNQIEYKEFEVSEDNSIVAINYGPDANEVKETTLSEVKEASSVKEIEEANDNTPLIIGISVIVGVGILVCIVMLMRKKYKHGGLDQ